MSGEFVISIFNTLFWSLIADKKVMANEFKEKGNQALKEGKIDEAIGFYSKGIEIDGKNHILFSNRSAAYAKKEQFDKALEDAEQVVSIKPDWGKGYSRKGSALQFLGRFEEAKMAFENGLKYDSNNEQLLKGKRECEDELTGPAGSQPLGNPFGNIDAILPRLRENPKTKAYVDDPSYMSMLTELAQDPKTLTKHLTDPRMSDTLSVLLGFDLKMPGDMSQDDSQNDTAPPPKVSETKITEVNDNMETDLSEDSKKALVEKDLGNACYKKKDFVKALEHYDRAIELDAENLTFYSNKAAVYFEQGEYEKCRETCLQAIDIGREHRADYKLIAKVFARIGNSFMKEKNHSEAVKFFNKSLTEHRVKDVLDKLHQCEREIKEAERLAYINPEMSLEEKEKGNDAFKAGKFPEAVKFYTEAINRNPEDAKLYSNRAASYMKLMEFNLALKDSDTCIKCDSTFVKGYIRKGAAMEAMKRNSDAMDAYQKALDLDPNAKEASEGYYRCLNNNLQTRNDPESVRQRAMNDPEVQQIMTDPAMKMILEQMQNDPKALRDHLKNPEIAKKIQKLMDVGVLTLR